MFFYCHDTLMYIFFMNPQQLSNEPNSPNSYFEAGAPLDIHVLDTMRPLPEADYKQRLFEWLQTTVEMVEMDDRINPKTRNDLRKIAIETLQSYNINYNSYFPNERVISEWNGYLGNERSNRLLKYRSYKQQVARLGTNLKQEIDDLGMTEEDLALRELFDSIGMYDSKLQPYYAGN